MCTGTDLTDATAELDCRDTGIDFYLARWSKKINLAKVLADDLAYGECEYLEHARGTITLDGGTIGHGGGCHEDATFTFTLAASHTEGSVSLTDEAATLQDTQRWFKTNRPGISKVGKLSGMALGPVLGELSLKALKPIAQRVAYRTLFRHIEDYAHRLVYFKAKVLQVTDDGALVLVTRDRYGSWHDVVFITYTEVDRVLDGDVVEFVGPGGQTYSYVTVQGAEKEVPEVDAIDIRVL